MKESQKKFLNSILNFNILIGTILVIASTGILIYLLVPQIIYTVFPQASENEIISINYPVTTEEQLEQRLSDRQDTRDQAPQLPPKDPSLPTAPTLSITKAGIDTRIYQDNDSNAALNKGPWMVPDHGDPLENDLPIIIASHRFGAIGWTKEERELRSFNKLPDLRSGDTVNIAWDQRLFEYQVYMVEESTQITDYNADLILYTCKVIWQSPVRIFVYANRVTN